MPYKCDDARVDGWALKTLDELLTVAGAGRDPGVGGGGEDEDEGVEGGGRSIVEIVPTVMFKRDNGGPKVEDFVEEVAREGEEHVRAGGSEGPLPSWTGDARLSFQHLSVEMLWWQNRVLRMRIPSLGALSDAGYGYAWLLNAPVVDAPRMLAVRKREGETPTDIAAP